VFSDIVSRYSVFRVHAACKTGSSGGTSFLRGFSLPHGQLWRNCVPLRSFATTWAALEELRSSAIFCYHIGSSGGTSFPTIFGCAKTFFH
jgi:hypothetical protein